MGNCHFNNDCGYHAETGEFVFHPKLVIKLHDSREIINIANNQSINNEEINPKSNIQNDDKLIGKIDKIIIKIIKDEILYLDNKEIDIIYMIDSTASMKQEIKNSSTFVFNNSYNLRYTYPKCNFRFGIIFYNDPINVNTDFNAFKQLTENLEEIKSCCDNWSSQSGGDEAEDWVGGYTIALDKINWRNKDKIIVHICDAPAHGKKYSKGSGDNHKDKKFEVQLDNIMKRCARENFKIIGLTNNSKAKNCFIKCKNIYDSEKGSFFTIREYDNSLFDFSIFMN